MSISYRQYQKMKDAARRKFDDEIQAIELVWQQHGDRATKKHPSQKTPASIQVPSSVNQFDEIKETIKTLKSPFTVADLKRALPHIRPEYMSTALFRLSGSGVKIVDNKRPKKYEVLEQKASAHA